MGKDVSGKKWPMWLKILLGCVSVAAVLCLGALIYAATIADSLSGGIMGFFNTGAKIVPK